MSSLLLLEESSPSPEAMIKKQPYAAPPTSEAAGGGNGEMQMKTSSGTDKHSAVGVGSSGGATLIKKHFTRAEIAKRDEKKEEAWMIVNDKVYNLDKFAKHHPGGAYVLRNIKNSDVTEQFYSIHTEKTIKRLERGIYSGYVVGSVLDEDAAGESSSGSTLSVSDSDKIKHPLSKKVGPGTGGSESSISTQTQGADDENSSTSSERSVDQAQAENQGEQQENDSIINKMHVVKNKTRRMWRSVIFGSAEEHAEARLANEHKKDPRVTEQYREESGESQVVIYPEFLHESHLKQLQNEPKVEPVSEQLRKLLHNDGPLSIKKIREAIPKHCFVVNVWRSCVYLMVDLFFVFAGLWVARNAVWYDKFGVFSGDAAAGGFSLGDAMNLASKCTFGPAEEAAAPLPLVFNLTRDVLSSAELLDQIPQIPLDPVANPQQQATLAAEVIGSPSSTFCKTATGTIAFSFLQWLLISLFRFGLLLPALWMFSGSFMNGLIAIGHDCAHGLFCNSATGNKLWGMVAHGAVWYPHTSWGRGHINHHLKHNHITEDFGSRYDCGELAGDCWCFQHTRNFGRYASFTMPFFGMPVYLYCPDFCGVDGCHILPAWFSADRLWKMATESDIFWGYVSTASCGAWGMIWYFALYHDGSAQVASTPETAILLSILDFSLLFLPTWLWGNFCFFVCGYFQHHAAAENHSICYDDSTWNYTISLFQTVDRKYGGLWDHVFHHLTDGHVAHHLFFATVPHYHLIETTHALKNYLDGKGLGHWYKCVDHHETGTCGGWILDFLADFQIMGFRKTYVTLKNLDL